MISLTWVMYAYVVPMCHDVMDLSNFVVNLGRLWGTGGYSIYVVCMMVEVIKFLENKILHTVSYVFFIIIMGFFYLFSSFIFKLLLLDEANIWRPRPNCFLSDNTVPWEIYKKLNVLWATLLLSVDSFNLSHPHE